MDTSKYKADRDYGEKKQLNRYNIVQGVNTEIIRYKREKNVMLKIDFEYGSGKDCGNTHI